MLAFGHHALSGWPSTLVSISRTTVLGRGKMRRLLWRALPKVRLDTVDVRAYDVNWRLYPLDNTVERKLLLRPEQYCSIERQYIQRMLAETSQDFPFVFLDIGANIGALSLHACRASHLKLVCVEPDPRARQRLIDNCRLNNFDDVSIESVAISDHVGHATLTIDATDLKFSGIDGRWAQGEQIEVETLSLLDLCVKHELGHIDLLKIDIEGHEDKALLPFFESADSALWPKHIIIEAIEREGLPECLKTMEHLGYQESERTRANRIYQLAL